MAVSLIVSLTLCKPYFLVLKAVVKLSSRFSTLNEVLNINLNKAMLALSLIHLSRVTVSDYTKMNILLKPIFFFTEQNKISELELVAEGP